MEHRGAPGHGVQGPAPGEVECPPGPAQSPGDVAPGPPTPAGTPGAGAPAGLPGPTQVRPSTGGPSTGDTGVDEAVARLDDLAGLPVAEHPAVFEYVHQRLTETLGDLDVRDQAGPSGQEPDAPGG
jgi:hypothetical protein